MMTDPVSISTLASGNLSSSLSDQVCDIACKILIFISIVRELCEGQLCSAPCLRGDDRLLETRMAARILHYPLAIINI